MFEVEVRIGGLCGWLLIVGCYAWMIMVSYYGWSSEVTKILSKGNIGNDKTILKELT